MTHCGYQRGWGIRLVFRHEDKTERASFQYWSLYPTREACREEIRRQRARGGLKLDEHLIGVSPHPVDVYWNELGWRP